MRDRDRARREWARMDEDEVRDVRRDAEPRHYGRGRGDFERQYGSGSGPEGYGGRDYAHTGSFTGSPSDFSEPSGRHRARGPEYGSGSRGYGSYERMRRSEGRDERTRTTSFGDEPPSFGMGMMGNFGFDRGGEGGGGYFGGSDRGKPTTASYSTGHGSAGGDVDRGFAGNSAAGGTDRGYSGGLNYGWGGGAYRSGMAEDRFSDVPAHLRQQEQTMRSHRGVGPRNYQRSDDRLRELVSERLEDDHDVDASEIEVFVEGGVVRLTGTVPERRMKRFAEEVAESVRGVTDVRNELRVTR